MIYKVHVIANRDSYGYSYFRTKKDDVYYEAELESFKTPRTKQEIISALNIHGGHEDNG